jgi:signal peptide peptidase SppA
VLDIDSPGGSIYGVPELAQEIFAAREKKKVVAVANSLAASAAYWLAAAASEVVVTPSGDVGSVGVYAMHEDISRLLDQEGVTVTFISAGKFKTEGNPYEPLSEEGRSFMQERVDEAYAMFTRDLARFRDVPVAKVKSDFGEGRVVGAKAAKAAGMVDRIASLEDTLARLGVAHGTNRIRMAAESEIPALAAREVAQPPDLGPMRARFYAD